MENKKPYGEPYQESDITYINTLANVEYTKNVDSLNQMKEDIREIRLMLEKMIELLSKQNETA